MAASKTDEQPDVAEQKEPATPVLSISTLAPERALIEVDGKAYELAVMDDFGIDEQQKLTRDGSEFDRLWNQQTLTDIEGARMKQLLDRMFDKVVLECPKTVRAKIKDASRSQIVLAFTLAPLAKAAARETAMEEEKAREMERTEKENSTTEN